MCLSDQEWVSDITYIWIEEGWLYLAVVLMLDSRRVIWLGYRSAYDSCFDLRLFLIMAFCIQTGGANIVLPLIRHFLSSINWFVA